MVRRRVGSVRSRGQGRSVVARWQNCRTIVGRWRGVGVRGGALRRRNHSGRRADNANRRWRVYDAGHHAGGGSYNSDGRSNDPGATIPGHRVARVDGVTRLVHLFLRMVSKINKQLLNGQGME